MDALFHERARGVHPHWFAVYRYIHKKKCVFLYQFVWIHTHIIAALIRCAVDASKRNGITSKAPTLYMQYLPTTKTHRMNNTHEISAPPYAVWHRSARGTIPRKHDARAADHNHKLFTVGFGGARSRGWRSVYVSPFFCVRI